MFEEDYIIPAYRRQPFPPSSPRCANASFIHEIVVLIGSNEKQLLNRADWPRKLSFSTPEAVAVEGEDQPLLLGLGITDPEIVSYKRSPMYLSP